MLTSFFKSSKLWFFLTLAGVCTLAVLLFRALTVKPVPGTQAPVIPPKLEEAVNKAREEALVAKTEAKIRADSQRAELDAVLKIDDGPTRRKKLAELLEKLPKTK